MKFPGQNYIIAVTKVEYAASVADKTVYLATEFKFIGLKCKDTAEDAVKSANQRDQSLSSRGFLTSEPFTFPLSMT